MLIVSVNHQDGTESIHAADCKDLAQPRNKPPVATQALFDVFSREQYINLTATGHESFEEDPTTWKQYGQDLGTKFLPCCKLPDTHPAFPTPAPKL